MRVNCHRDVVAVLFLFMAVNSFKQKPLDVEAMFDFKRSVEGVVLSVDVARNTFSVQYQSSSDQAMAQANISVWTVHLIPGRSSDTSCFLTRDLEGSLSLAVPADCSVVVSVGRKVRMSYVFLNIPDLDVVVRYIIGLQPF